MTRLALRAPAIFDGAQIHEDRVLLVEDGSVLGILRPDNVPADAPIERFDEGLLGPGFVDLQVNGGGGVLFNEERSVEGLRRICGAHAPFGTTALLPTLITDRPDVTAEAVAAGIAAQEAGVPGFAGLHLEGPHLSLARKGAHDPSLIRAMEEGDLAALVEARRRLPTLLTTVAPESVAEAQIARLAASGIVVSLGHTDASAGIAAQAFAAGATMTTHLFNAMSQLTNREPGLVGATLEGGAFAGLIADGLHVDRATMAVALRAQIRPDRIFLVTDAMSTIGTDLDRFTLNGRTILRRDGALRLADGTLAGADLTMIDAVRYTHRSLGVPLEEAWRMASLYPARAIGRADRLGHLRAGARASVLHLDGDLGVSAAWIDGRRAV